MKQKSLIALFLGAILVLTISSTDIAFADYDEEYEEESDRYDDEDYNSSHDDDESERYDDDDKYEKERRS